MPAQRFLNFMTTFTVFFLVLLVFLVFPRASEFCSGWESENQIPSPSEKPEKLAKPEKPVKVVIKLWDPCAGTGILPVRPKKSLFSL